MHCKDVIVKELGTEMEPVEFRYPALVSVSEYLPKDIIIPGDELVSTIEKIVGCVKVAFEGDCNAPYNLYAEINRKGSYKVMSNENIIVDAVG